MKRPEKMSDAKYMRIIANEAQSRGKLAIATLKLLKDSMERMGYTEGNEFQTAFLIEEIEQAIDLAISTADYEEELAQKNGR